jgi:hypothetical protein
MDPTLDITGKDLSEEGGKLFENLGISLIKLSGILNGRLREYTRKPLMVSLSLIIESS